MNAINLIDGYKINHVFQYPEKTSLVYSNLTPRFSRDPDIDRIVVFGIQYFLLKYLSEEFDDSFFRVRKESAVRGYSYRVNSFCGYTLDVSHIEKLHALRYLPLHIKALPEGTLCPLKVPCLTIQNTHPDFAWLVNYIETILSCVLWGPMTSATTAWWNRTILDNYAELTGGNPDVVPFQSHDFSMRGMFGLEAAVLSGAGHLLSFTGTDCIPAIDFVEDYYDSFDPDRPLEMIGMGVPATEHSVMCIGGMDNELDTYRRLMNEVHPTGLLSIVSDTWDYWDIIDNGLKALLPDILSRDGKVVIRPDSGDPVDITLKTIPKLWELFGGTVNHKGYRDLHPNIGLIYGDGINRERMQAILKGLKKLGFSSTNVVFGNGSYTYQYKTRDEFGFAMKATAAVVDNKVIEVFKDPKTDDGGKKSAKGFLHVTDDLKLIEQASPEQEASGALRTVFKDGKLFNVESFDTIKARLRNG